VIAFIRGLDARYPRGSIDLRAELALLEEYWGLACPLAPLSQQRLAAHLSKAVLTTVEGTAIAARSQSATDPYTTIRAGDGRVAAAIDARKSYVKLDFRCRQTSLKSRGHRRTDHMESPRIQRLGAVESRDQHQARPS
jgi:hypothetical protein